MVRIFGHYLPKPLLLLGVIEAAILLAAMYVGVSLYSVEDPEAAMAGHALATAMFFVLVMVTVMTVLGLYQRDPQEGEWGYFPRLGASFLVGLLLMSLAFQVAPFLSIAAGAFAPAFGLAMVGVTAVRLLYLRWSDARAATRRILVLGAGKPALKLEALAAQASGRRALEIVGYMPIDGAHETAPARVLADVASVEATARKYDVDEIVVAVRDRRACLPLTDLLACKLKGVKIVDLATFFERESGRLEIDALNPGWLIFSDGFEQSPGKRALKRAFDLAASAALLLLAWPIMLAAAILIYLEDQGPIFYRQERVGENGEVFELIKFRSMRVDAEGNGVPQWAKQDDDRVTRVGRIIRKIRVDELPQVFNALKGEMSFVGPRPERPYFVNQLNRSVPYYACRHAVKPGITGWAQVRYPYGASVEDAVQKLQYDLYYIKNNSLFLDVIILFQTLRVLVSTDGAR